MVVYKLVLTEAELRWPDLNSQASVDWRRAELAGLTWIIKPVLTEDELRWSDLNSQTEWSIHVSPTLD